MFDSVFLVALLKLSATFAVILILLRLHCKLWQAILAGGLVIAAFAAFSGVPLTELAVVPLVTAQDSTLVLMEVMIFGILILSGLQDANGQSQRLVEALDRYLRWPRIRLVVFPALVGLLPMPGGALFSCPMLDAAAHGINLSNTRKTLINYWFRHIWETSWPLYPGFILLCSLLGISMFDLIKYTIPFVFISVSVGWFFYMRDIKITAEAVSQPTGDVRHPLAHVFYEALPILITIIGAMVFGAILSNIAPELPSQLSFVASLSLAILVAFWQGRGRFKVPLTGLILNKRTFSMLALIYMIFVFKDMIAASGIVSNISQAGSGVAAVILMVVVLSFVCGMLTGVMVGYIGAAFPIFLALIVESGLQAYTVPLIMLGLVSGQIGQLASPLHICLVVTCEYYRVDFTAIWRILLKSLAVLFALGASWTGVLYLLGAQF